MTASPPARRGLVVDDNEAMRAILRELLMDEGYAVSLASDGAEALSQVAAQPPDFIILDLEMPVMDGRQFFRALRAAGLAIPVLVLSGANARTNAREMGADAGLEKPFDLDLLLRRVARLLEG